MKQLLIFTILISILYSGMSQNITANNHNSFADNSINIQPNSFNPGTYLSVSQSYIFNYHLNKNKFSSNKQLMPIIKPQREIDINNFQFPPQNFIAIYQHSTNSYAFYKSPNRISIINTSKPNDPNRGYMNRDSFNPNGAASFGGAIFLGVFNSLKKL